MSYKAIPKEAPNITVAGLVLIQIKLHLKKFGFLRLQKTGYFVNYFLGEEYFTFTKFYYGPYSHSILYRQSTTSIGATAPHGRG